MSKVDNSLQKKVHKSIYNKVNHPKINRLMYKMIFFEKENGKKHVFTFNADAEILAGTTVLSGLKRPISSHYNGQYKAVGTGEVIVLQDSQIIAVLTDFDPNFTLVDAGLHPIQVVNAAGEADVIYIKEGEGLLNIGTEVFDDPAGTMIFADAVITMVKWAITVAGGVVAGVEQIETQPEEAVMTETSLFTLPNEEGGKIEEIQVFVEGSPKLLAVVGTEVWMDIDKAKALRDGTFSFRDIYFITTVRGVVADVNTETKDPVKK